MRNCKPHFYIETVIGYRAKKKNLYFAFIDLEKDLDRMPRDVAWWALRKVGVGLVGHIEYLTDDA